ncbi:hypothetical protein Q1695_015032 [Nippostrongylus brasiliensis]|nr:hypothetical protein Q1695_015032 [Nippostrongylus brasiliensis]
MDLTNSIKNAMEELDRVHREIWKKHAIIREKGLEYEFELWKNRTEIIGPQIGTNHGKHFIQFHVSDTSAPRPHVC